MARCYNPKMTGFKYWGGRGIVVHAPWHDFVTFLADMGERPSRQHSVDRKDNDGNYTPENARWATRAQQASNQRRWKLTREDIPFIRHWVACGYGQVKISEAFGVSHTQISYIANGKQWVGA